MPSASPVLPLEPLYNALDHQSTLSLIPASMPLSLNQGQLGGGFSDSLTES
jgi:hypothetical protein